MLQHPLKNIYATRQIRVEIFRDKSIYKKSVKHISKNYVHPFHSK